MTAIRGAIIDVDGTLLDSMAIWDKVAVDYLISNGVQPSEDLNDKLLGMGGHEIPNYFKNQYGIKGSSEDIQKGINKLLEDFYYFKAPLKAGVAGFLDELRSRGIKMCIATATDRHLIEAALKRCGIYDYFERIFTCGEEKTSKSNPEIYFKAADYLGVDISQTLVAEDAFYAIKTAKEAGFFVIGVFDRAEEDQQEAIKQICNVYCRTLEEFVLEDCR